MGDLMKCNPIFAKLGCDESNQWILYADGMQDFFNWMASNVTESNFVTDAEIYEEQDLKVSDRWYEDEDLENGLNSLERDYPGILTCNEKDVNNAKNEIRLLRDMHGSTEQLNAKIESMKTNSNREISDLELATHDGENRLKRASNLAIEKAKDFLGIQKSNAELITELRGCFTETYMPPLFMHEMPLDEYFSQCDVFQQYLNTYLNGNIKIKNSADSGNIEEKCDQTIDELKELERQLYSAELKLVETNIRTAGFQKLMDELDISSVPKMIPSQLNNEIHGLEANNKNLENESEALMSELKHLLQISAQQEVEKILYENTKIKLERARKRLETMKSLSLLSSGSLNHAEIIWIVMQLDLEKIKIFCDNPPAPSNDSAACARRNEIMLQIKGMHQNNQGDVFVGRFADLLKQPNTLKGCIQEYERYSRLSRKARMQQLEKLKSIEKIYLQYIFDGPIDGPMLDIVRFLEPIFDVKRTKDDFEKALRQIRYDIQSNVTEKRDRFWHYQQVLWMWFLTEPKKIDNAIEDARKAASKSSNVKTLAGIKRK